MTSDEPDPPASPKPRVLFIVAGQCDGGFINPFIWFDTEAKAKRFIELADMHGSHYRRKVIEAEPGE